MQESSIGVVMSTNKYDIQVQPNVTITLPGLIRKKEGMKAAVTEGTEAPSSRIGVCPRIVSLDFPGKYQRVPVRLNNMSAKILR